MELLGVDCYKEGIRQQVKFKQFAKHRLTLQELARRIPIQNTYLSKVLNDPNTHLCEGDLFRACRILDLSSEETEYLLLLRSFQTADDPGYRTYLERKISHFRSAHCRRAKAEHFDTTASISQMAYLLEPNCVLVHVGLMVDVFQKNPRALAAALGLANDQMKLVLQKLRDIEFITTTEDVWTVTGVQVKNPHFGPSHPLMRSHQALMRQKSSIKIHELPENEKHVFLGTFSGDASTFLELKKLMAEFTQRAADQIAKAPSKNIYQIGFELFKWV